MQLPARIGKYELEKFLGGGMSHVYQARDTVIGRKVAVKILTEQGCMDPEAKARFLREAQTSGNIRHDNIISIYDYGEEQGRPYIVMEFLVGQDLRQAIEKGETGGVDEKLRIALQVARALEYVHAQKIVHRDIKPENIHLDPDGRAKLMDFGIAKSEGLQITQAGFTVGTPYYMPPEQVLGQPVGETADVYAFGILLFELFTGVKPISGDTIQTLFYKILNEPVDLEPLRGSGAPEAVCDLVARCTAKLPQDRVQTFSQVRGELASMLSEPVMATVSTAAPDAVPRESRVSGKWIAGGLLLLVVAVAGGLIWSKRPKTYPPTIQTRTGVMMLVPGGSYEQYQNIPPFYMDRTEVTNERYAQYAASTPDHPLPATFPKDRPYEPVVNVTISDARAYCKAVGKRLPDNAEWEKAARGVRLGKYPWGNEEDASRANVSDNPALGSAKKVVAADSMTQGSSYFGVLHMAGNVFEYVSDETRPSQQIVDYFATVLKPPPARNEPWHWIKGGSFNRPLREAVPQEKATIPARFSAEDIGFRCAVDAATARE